MFQRKIFLRIFVTLFCFTSTSISLAAGSLEKAEELYKRRQEGFATIHLCRDEYLAVLNGASGDAKFYVIEQLARLGNYETLLLGMDEKEKIRALSTQGLQILEKMDAPYRKNYPQYTYWKAMSTLAKSYATSMTEIAVNIQDIIDWFEFSTSVNARYEGGGSRRYLGYIYLKLPEFNPFGPSQDLEKAEAYLDEALKSAAYEKEKNPATATGVFFYMTYAFKAELQDALGNRVQAKTLLADALRKYNVEKKVSVDRVPETVKDIEYIQKLLNSLNADKQNIWPEFPFPFEAGIPNF